MNIQINPQEIHGKWQAGYTLDRHLASRHDLSNKTHTAIGEMVYQVKHQHPPDRSKIQPLAEIAAQFVREKFVVNNDMLHRYLNAIIPTPPSDEDRPFQPVTEIAKEIGNLLNRPVYYLKKVRQTRPMKDVPKEKRSEEIQGAFAVQSPQDLEKRWVLLFDDIYDTEATLTEVTKALYEQGRVRHVFVLTLTRTGRD